MSVVSLEFVLPLLVLAAVFFYLPGKTARQIVFSACNLASLFYCFGHISSWIALGIFVLSGYAMALVLARKPSAGILTAYLVVLIAAFLVLKKYVIIQPLLPASVWTYPIETMGLSYLLFRQIHLLVDVMQEQITGLKLCSYLNYQLNLFGFQSGPIQRYQEFQERWSIMRPLLMDRHDVKRAYIRLFVGLIKVPASTYIIQEYVKQRAWFLQPASVTSAGHVATLIRFAEIFYGYPVYLYFNFSGYCDVVISGAALLGIKMPENFDRPYLSRNMIDYWTRFHRSLGFWIRDYLFTPMYKAAATRWPQRGNLLVFPCYFVAFVLAGVWHGSTSNFVVFGVLHGIGVSIVKGWENFIVKRRGRKGLKEYLARQPVRILAIALTLNFVSLTMLFFPPDMNETFRVIHGFIHRMI